MSTVGFIEVGEDDTTFVVGTFVGTLVGTVTTEAAHSFITLSRQI
jgi:hypothetical protein